MHIEKEVSVTANIAMEGGESPCFEITIIDVSARRYLLFIELF